MPCVHVVIEVTDQSAYTEGRYYSSAQDATEIVGVFKDYHDAEMLRTSLEKRWFEEHSKNANDDDGEEYWHEFRVETFAVQ